MRIKKYSWLIGALVAIYAVVTAANYYYHLDFLSLAPVVVLLSAFAAKFIFDDLKLFLQTDLESTTKSEIQEQIKNVVQEELTAVEACSKAIITEAERVDLIKRLKSSLEKSASEVLLTEIKSQLVMIQTRDDIDKRLQAVMHRLSVEVAALSKRSDLNLILGVMIAMGGSVALAYFVFTHNRPVESAVELVEYFVPRLSLVLLIELFSYFFLRLYKETLDNIKYFQNEITNIEAKSVALIAAFHVEDKGILESVIKDFSSTERNFIIEKGQTTIDLERERLNQSTILETIKNLSGFFGKNK